MPVWGDYRITWRQILPPAALVVAAIAAVFTVRSCSDDRHDVTLREQREVYRLQLQNPEPGMVAQAVRRLGEIGEPEDVERLRPFLDREEPRVVGAALEALGCLGDEAAKEKILDGLRSSEPEIAAGAASGAGALELGEAVEPLSKLLSSRHFDVRLAAIRALGALGDAKAIAALEGLEARPAAGLRGEPTDDERAALAEAVGKALASLRGIQ